MEYLIQNGELSIMQKLEILTDAAKYDVACTSSGVERKGDGKYMGNCTKAGICHSFSSDGRCISLLKILMTNECIFDCKYCLNRKSNDVPRATFTPEEICTLTMEFYRRNYIEGLFLSSGIIQDPTFTMELLYRTIWLLRTLAPNKHRKNILTPMRQIQNGIHANKEELILYRKSPVFVSGGQSTQMIIGATPETDYQILNVADNLYQKFELKRVFYSAFVKVNEDKSLPALPGGPPLLREHRLYQADWLLRFYGFKAEELLDEKRPFFNVMLDPKEDWAVRHLECFPVEINRAPYADLLRVPGIGVKSARRILSARRSTKLTFQDLKKLGVVMKRAVYFITCGGRMMYPTKLEEDYIVRNLTDPKERIRFGSDGMSYRQMTLFDDGMFPNGVRQEEVLPAAVGEL